MFVRSERVSDHSYGPKGENCYICGFWRPAGKLSADDSVQNDTGAHLVYYSGDSGTFSNGVKRPELEAGHSSESNAKVNPWSFISTFLALLHGLLFKYYFGGYARAGCFFLVTAVSRLSLESHSTSYTMDTRGSFSENKTVRA
jgi:hypothetical protein